MLANRGAEDERVVRTMTKDRMLMGVGAGDDNSCSGACFED